MAKTPAQAAANFVKGMSGAAAAYAAGTGAVQSSPMQAAAAMADKAAANYAASISSGQWAAKLQAVPLSTWKAQCAAAGARLASGALKGQQKYLAAVTALQPVYAAMKQAAMGAAGASPGQKAAAAIDVLVAAGRKGKAAGG